MNNEFNPVTATYHKHDEYELIAEISGRFVRIPILSVKTIEPLACCFKGDEIEIKVQSWVLIKAGLNNLITAHPN